MREKEEEFKDRGEERRGGRKERERGRVAEMVGFGFHLKPEKTMVP